MAGPANIRPEQPALPSARAALVLNSLLAALCVGFFACRAEEIDLPDANTVVTEHFVLHSRDGDQQCATTPAALEAHFTSAQQALGFNWPEGKRIHYYLYRDAEDATRSGACPSGRPACADKSGNAVYSWIPMHRHELIHAYLGAIGQPHEIYGEGMAEVFRCESGPLARPDMRGWEDALFEKQNGAFVAYDATMRLVRAMIRRFGLPRMMAIYRTSRAGLGPQAFSKEFFTFTGVTLDDFWKQAATLAAVPICLCDGARVPLTGNDVEVASCDNRDPQREAVFALSEAAMVAVEAEGALPSELLIRHCGAREDSDRLAVVPGIDTRGLTIGSLNEGQYFVSGADRLNAKAFSASSASLEACATAPQHTLKPDIRYGSVGIFGDDSNTTVVTLRVPKEQVSAGVSSGSVRVCTSCPAVAPAAESCPLAEEALRQGTKIIGDYIMVLPPGSRVAFSLE